MISSVTCPDPERPALLTWTVTVTAPSEVGVPETVPSVARARPVGKEPERRDQA